MTHNRSLRTIVASKFLIVIIILATLLILFLPVGLKNYFIEEAYRTIEISQEGPTLPNATTIDSRTVNHIVVSKFNGIYYVNSDEIDMDSNFIRSSLANLNLQREDQQRYLYEDSEKSVYYVISKNGDLAIISFVLTTYVDYYIDTLYRQLSVLIVLLFIISFIISIFVSNSITIPLITISNKIKSISNNNWDEEIPITRRDEIGQIEKSLEELRKTLKSREKSQQEMFQNISHDLKTPIMIIEGYSQLIKDGFVPNEEINETVDSIMEEAKRLEHKVKSLLYINKLDQIYADKKTFEEIDLEELIHAVITPYKKQYTNIQFIVDLKTNDLVNGQFEDWRVAIENIIDNMTRFAKTTIKLDYHNETITITNDGEHIDEKKLNKLFEPYVVANNSKFGLGLAITKKILNTFGYQITVDNIEVGVKFEITKVKK